MSVLLSDGKPRPLTKNEKRRLKEKQKAPVVAASSSEPSSSSALAGLDVEIEYVSASSLAASEGVVDAAALAEFQAVFQKFAKPEELVISSSSSAAAAAKKEQEEAEGNGGQESTGEGSGGGDDANGKLSKKKLKLLNRVSVAELKQAVQRPDVIEAHDVTSSDPHLLVYLKAYRNSVPVPRHWSSKSKYLQRKRGTEKPPFKLPEFIADTGIAKIRDSLLEAEERARSKSRARARVQPKMGKIDIDYQVLHDAFFKFQTKPKFTSHGELYYEGKEFETNARDYKPGVLSAALLAALDLPNSRAPPPWLTNMQRYGPPPSYPSLRIPGLNAPIPKDASFGYHPGGWGKPPVDEYGRPIYGDVFGAYAGIDEGEEIVDKATRWGALMQDAEEEDDDDDDDDDDDEVADEAEGAAGGEGNVEEGEEAEAGQITESSTSTSSVQVAIDPVIFGEGALDLRKRDAADSHAKDPSPPRLYTVLSEKATAAGGAGGGELFGSSKTYDLAQGAAVASGEGDDGAATVSKQGGDKSKRKRVNEGEQAAKKFKDSFKF